MSTPKAPPPRITFPIPSIETKGWGREIILINIEQYCSKILCFNAGSQGSLHFHDLKTETWYVQEGEVELTWVDPENAEVYTRVLKAEAMVHIPRLCAHQVRALTDARILEVSTPHYDADSYRIAKGDSQRRVAVV